MGLIVSTCYCYYCHCLLTERRHYSRRSSHVVWTTASLLCAGLIQQLQSMQKTRQRSSNWSSTVCLFLPSADFLRHAFPVAGACISPSPLTFKQRLKMHLFLHFNSSLMWDVAAFGRRTSAPAQFGKLTSLKFDLLGCERQCTAYQSVVILHPCH